MNNKIKLTSEQLEKALKAFEIVLNAPIDPDRFVIDAAIQRYEFAIELSWKLLKRILENEGTLTRSPKHVLQEAFSAKLIDDDALWIKMLDDCNMTSHTYNEDLPDEIFSHLKNYYTEMVSTLQRLKSDNIIY